MSSRDYYVLHRDAVIARAKRYQQSHREAGMCIFCSNPAIKRSYCESCERKLNERARSKRAYNIKLQRQYKQFRLAHNQCYNCGAPLMDDETKYCITCKVGWSHNAVVKGVLKYETAD